ncbi:TPA: hypothetical protein ACWRQX_002686, partial [Staphylococcus aureus]
SSKMHEQHTTNVKVRDIGDDKS